MMKKVFLMSLTILAAMFVFSTDAMAKVTEETDSVQKIDFDKVPAYKAVRYNLTNDDGTPKLNADGTQATRVLLTDANGNIKSWEAVHQQYRQLDKAVTNIVAKVGGGLALGALAGGLLSGDWKGAVAGAVAGGGAGALLSKNDIKKAKALKKELKSMKKELELYHQAYTDEGLPISASASLSHFENIEERTVSNSQVDAVLASNDFNTADSPWELN